MTTAEQSDRNRPSADAPPKRCIVLFDMDGVLIEGRGTDGVVHEQALESALTDRSLDPDAETYRLLSGYEYDTDFVQGCRRLGVDPVGFYERRERYSAKRSIDRLAADSRTPYDDVEVLTELADDYTLGLVSNNYDEVVQFVVDRHNLDVFEYAQGRAPGVRGFYRRKPDPHYLLEAMDSLDGPAGIYVGDRATDVLAAMRAGLDAAFIQRPHNNTDDLPVAPAIVADSLEDFASQLVESHRLSRPPE